MYVPRHLLSAEPAARFPHHAGLRRLRDGVLLT
jgi:hypothetical protein